MNNKKAILVVSFGTSYKETREKTIDQIELDIQNYFPNYKVYRAFTSNMIIKKLKRVYDLSIDTVSEALNRIVNDGVNDLIVQPTHIINGIENDFMISEIEKFKLKFNSIKIGSPLLTSTSDYIDLVETIIDEYSFIKDDEALVCMGHGTEHHANSAYISLDYIFKAHDKKNFFIGTVEGYPEIDIIVKALKKFKPSKVYLVPLMIVAGDHANNDMAGEEDSFKTKLQDEGFEPECIIKGLGEYEDIRKIYIIYILPQII